MNSPGALYERFVFSPLLRVADRVLSQVRSDLLSQARGRVLEIGIGSGLSLDYYGPDVEQLVGIEPCAPLLAQCRARLGRLPGAPATELVQCGAERLPFEDDAFDTVVAFLVFCTIPEPERAAREIRRVLKPDGRLLFFEHVHAAEPGLARWQNRINPLWKPLTCGCNLNRDTRSLFARAGFDMSAVRVGRHPSIPMPLVSHVIEGVVPARAPGRPRD